LLLFVFRTDLLVYFLRKCRGEHIIHLHDFYYSPSFTVLVMDLFELDLAEYLRQQGKETTNPSKSMESLVLCQQLASGISHLAACLVVHRDVHAKNVLLRRNPLQLTIADFGRAAVGVGAALVAMTSLVYVAGARPPEIWFSQGSKWNRDGSWKQPSVAYYGLESLK
jgi:serine/threonine protein kinase